MYLIVGGNVYLVVGLVVGGGVYLVVGGVTYLVVGFGVEGGK